MKMDYVGGGSVTEEKRGGKEGINEEKGRNQRPNWGEYNIKDRKGKFGQDHLQKSPFYHHLLPDFNTGHFLINRSMFLSSQTFRTQRLIQSKRESTTNNGKISLKGRRNLICFKILFLIFHLSTKLYHFPLPFIFSILIFFIIFYLSLSPPPLALLAFFFICFASFAAFLLLKRSFISFVVSLQGILQQILRKELVFPCNRSSLSLKWKFKNNIGVCKCTLDIGRRWIKNRQLKHTTLTVRREGKLFITF